MECSTLATPEIMIDSMHLHSIDNFGGKALSTPCAFESRRPHQAVQSDNDAANTASEVTVRKASTKRILALMG
jgi:hypothetical protein